MQSTFRNVSCLSLVLLALQTSQSATAEIIKLKSGKIINAPITERMDDHIKVNISGIAVTFYQDQIETISSDKTIPDPTPAANTKVRAPNISVLTESVSQSIVVIDAMKGQSSTEGTGFFVSSNGLIATNLHVILKAKFVKVITKSGRSYPVQYVANYDDDRDICLIKIDITDAPALPLGDSDSLQTGQILFTIGHREGARYQYTSGPYRGKKMIDGEENIQTKMVTGHGNSGGPILNEKGELVGISTLFTADGYNFSIPIKAAKEFFNYNDLITITDLNNKVSGAYELTFSGNGDFLEGKYGQALARYKQALTLDPNYLKAWIGSAKTYTAMQMDNEAFSAWQEVIARAPANIVANQRLGKIYLDRNMPDDAISHYQKAIDLAPQDSGVYSDLAFAYGQKKLYPKAITNYKKVIEIDPQSASGYYNLAVAYHNNHDFAMAKKYSEQAKQLGYNIPDIFEQQLNQSSSFPNYFELK